VPPTTSRVPFLPRCLRPQARDRTVSRCAFASPNRLPLPDWSAHHRLTAWRRSFPRRCTGRSKSKVKARVLQSGHMGDVGWRARARVKRAFAMLGNEHARIPIQAWFFTLWRFRAVFVDEAPAWRASLKVMQCNFPVQEAFHVRLCKAWALIDHHCKWRTHLRLYIGPHLCPLVPTSGGVQRALSVLQATCFLSRRLWLLFDLWRRQPGSISLSPCPLVADRASFFNGKNFCDRGPFK
jgi:hypothetical protein